MKVKGIAALVLSLSLLCPMTAQAASSEEAFALYQQVQAQQKAMTDMDAYYDFKLNVSGSALENMGVSPIDMRLEMNIKANHLTEPDQMQLMTYSRISMPDQSEMTYWMYYLNGYFYVDMLGEKVMYPMPMGETMKEAMAVVDTSLAEDMMRDLQVWEEGENKVIGYNIDENSMNEYLKTVLNSAGVSDLFEGMDIKFRNMHGEYVVNPQGQCIKTRMKMDMDMSMDGETITIGLDGDVGIANPGQPVQPLLPNPAEYTNIGLGIAA